MSFDIFDTLIERCIEPPEQIHFQVAKLVAKRIKTKCPTDLIILRDKVVNSLRASSFEEGNDPECKFDKIISGWVNLITGGNDNSLYNFIRDTELSLEHSALLVKSHSIQILKWLYDQNVKTIAISDMYLGEIEIRSILRKLDLEHYFHDIFISSEFALSKGSGRLHKHVLEKLEINPLDIVHIGDNIISDMWAPLKLGMSGVFLRDKKARIRRIKQSISSNLASKNNFWKGHQFFEIIKTRINSDFIFHEKSKEFYFKYGCDVLGPGFSSFTMGIVEKYLKEKPEKIFFLARDGFIFYDLVKTWLKKLPDLKCLDELEYIYVSRKVVASASVAKGLTLEQAKVPLFNPKQKGLYSILNAFGLDDRNFYETKAIHHGFLRLNEPIYDFNDSRLKKFLEDNEVQKKIMTSGKLSLAHFEMYFTQLGFFESKSVALVDIGWNGTIQKFLNDCFGNRPDFPRLYGWYFAFVPNMHGPIDNASGFLCEGKEDNKFDSAPQDFEEIFEQAAKSSEPTTISFRKIAEEVVPVLKDNNCSERKAEIQSDKMIYALQDGIRYHMHHFFEAHRLTGYNLKELKPYVSCLLERAVVYPTNEEVKRISKITHSEDFGQNDLLDLKAKYLGFLQLFCLRKTIKDLRKNANRYAVYGPFPPLLRGVLLRLFFLRK